MYAKARVFVLILTSITAAFATSAVAQEPALRPVVGAPLLWAKGSQSSAAGTRSPILGPQQGPGLPTDPTSARRFVATTLAAGAGSVLGGIVGAYVGAGADSSDDDIVSVVFGAVAGSWVGGSLFGAAASQRPARAILGSTLGVAAGIAVINASNGEAWLAYPLTHGLVTALIVAGVGER